VNDRSNPQFRSSRTYTNIEIIKQFPGHQTVSPEKGPKRSHDIGDQLAKPRVPKVQETGVQTGQMVAPIVRAIGVIDKSYWQVKTTLKSWQPANKNKKAQQQHPDHRVSPNVHQQPFPYQ